MPALRSLVLVAAVAVFAPLVSATSQAAGADLSITKADSRDPVTVGSSVRYTLTVSNAGPSDATGVSVDDAVPTEMSVGSVTASQGTCSPPAQAAHCDLGTVPAGAQATVEIVAAPLSPGTFTDTATVSQAGTDPDTSNNQASETTTAEGPACTIVGTWGEDTLRGTKGDDVICGLGGNDLLAGGAGDDVLSGGDGTDTVSYAGSPIGVRVDLAAGTATGFGSDTIEGVENVTGSQHDDVLSGSDGPNALAGLGGTDLLFGRGGADNLDGGIGSDFLDGGAGDDTLTGDGGVDTCLQDLGTGSRDCPGRVRVDGNDTKGPLDVSRVQLSPGATRVGVGIRTLSAWSPRTIWDHGFFVVLLDSFGDAKPDYEVLIRSDGVRLQAHLRRASGGGAPIARAEVGRTNLHEVSVSIPIARLRFDTARAYYRWQVESLWNDTPCPNVCFDVVNDGGAAAEPRP